MNQNYNGGYFGHLMVGRFNPLTIYHLEAMNKMPTTRNTVIAATRSQGDDKNPIPLGQKWTSLDRALTARGVPPYVSILCDNVLDGILQCRTFLMREIILYCGSDRADDYLRLNTYTEPEGIRVVDVVCIDRTDDHHSATYLRELAILGKKKEFKALCGYIGRDKDAAYHAIRSHYGCI